MAELWLLQNTTNISIHHIKQRIIDIYHQTWKTSVDESNRLSTYSWYKRVLTQDIYLDKIHIRKFKIAFTRFRVSSYYLFIEKGRHFNINRTDRLCIYCHMNVLENECHFLLVCPFYNNLRKQYFKPYFCHWPTKQKLITLMTSTNKITLLNVSKYIY